MFAGSLVALVTPFRNGRIDERALADLVQWGIGEGSHGVVPCGSTGEAATLSHEEHTEVVRLVVDVVRKRVPVIAGTGSNSTAEAVRLTREAQQAGADGALLISPYYNKPTQEGIYQHYREVAAAVAPFPIILYNIPGRTGSNVEPATMARLAEIANIVGVKEASGSIDQVLNIRSLCGDGLAIYSGEDSLTFSMMSLGGKGVITAAGSAAPKEMADLANACLAGKWEEAARMQIRLIPLIRALFLETNPIPCKAALALMGRCRDELRLPLVPMSKPNRDKLERTLKDYGLIG